MFLSTDNMKNLAFQTAPVGIMAVGQLRFDTEMVRLVTICTLSGFALAFGLSVGLGARDITRNVLAGFYARKIFTPGDPLEIRGQRGVLKAITATQQVEILAAALGKPIRMVQVPEPGARAAMLKNGMSEALADAILQLQRPETKLDPLLTTTVRDVTGREARRFADWARDHAQLFG